MKDGFEIRREAMRIGGQKVTAGDEIEVRYPYTDEVIGTVPAGRAEHAARAFDIAAAYRPRLSRYERQQILFKAAELIRERREDLDGVVGRAVVDDDDLGDHGHGAHAVEQLDDRARLVIDRHHHGQGG